MIHVIGNDYFIAILGDTI